MKSTNSWLVSMVAFFLLAVSCSATTDPATQSRIDHVCLQTSFYSYCLDIFNAHLSSNASNYKELTRIALSQTLRYVGDALVFMKKSERIETDYYLKGLYSRCGEDYNLVLKRFEHGTLAFAMGDIKKMLSEIENCGGFVEECEVVMGDKVKCMRRICMLGFLLECQFLVVASLNNFVIQ